MDKTYVELLTNTEISVTDHDFVRPLTAYHSISASQNLHAKNILMYDKKDILTEYLLLNRRYWEFNSYTKTKKQ